MKRVTINRVFSFVSLLAVASLGLPGCTEYPFDFNPKQPARGPSELLKGAQPITDGNFEGGNDAIPAPRTDVTLADGEVPSCDGACRSYCASLDLENPINQGVCPDLWGLGRAGRPIVEEEACRRLWVDTQGVYPTHADITRHCVGRPWGDVVKQLISTEAFLRVNRQRWADWLQYDTLTVSIERIADMDIIVSALYEGRVAYDHFAAITSAHPVLVRRNATPGDRAEALYWLFLGRPPFGQERSDIARLYHLWTNDYYDHPELGMRLPDAFIRYRCLDFLGEVDEATSGECTSVLYGFEQVILKPDARSVSTEREGLKMWSGLLTVEEWKTLQAPGRLLAANEWTFWEHAANTVLKQYLDYNLATLAPEVGERLARYLVKYNGDFRSLHFAVLTSYPYLQSAMGDAEPPQRFEHGPVKQVEAEGWVDSVTALTGGEQSRCDLLMNRPNDFLRAGSPAAIVLVNESDWTLNDDFSRIRGDYRDLVQTLGGCPDNSQGGRFKIVSVLTAANQLNYAGQICDPFQERGRERRGGGGDGGGDGRRGNQQRAAIEVLLPAGMTPSTALTPELARSVVQHQTQRFFARNATAEELTQAAAHGEECQRANCTAEEFARPVCFALVSSAEMLFY